MKRLRRCTTVLLLVGSLLADGCSSLAGRFLSRAVTEIGSSVEPAPRVATSPVLVDPALAVLWAGHATVLIQIHDKIFITDPMLTETVGMMVRRKISPGLNPASLEKIDYTVVSHIHFDHLSYGSLDQLPQNGVLLVPLGALAYTPDFDFSAIRELAPWDALEEDGVRITAVPVQHFSGRYGFDMLWMKGGFTGYVIEYRGKTVFFGGDTGYHPELFKEVGRRFHVDVAILPIAPIEPRDFMQRYHMDPADALQVFNDVGARLLVPVHHRTFIQGLDSTLTFAVEQLRDLAAAKGLTDRLVVLDVGEQRVLF